MALFVEFYLFISFKVFLILKYLLKPIISIIKERKIEITPNNLMEFESNNFISEIPPIMKFKKALTYERKVLSFARMVLSMARTSLKMISSLYLM